MAKPEELFQRVALLRGLDGRGRADLALAVERRSLRRGETLFRCGEPADCLYVVESGAIELTNEAGSRSDAAASSRAVERRIDPGDVVGEEALAATFGLRRHTARCCEGARVFSIPAPLLRRVWSRIGATAEVTRAVAEQTRLAVADALRESALSLTPSQIQSLCSDARLVELERGDVLLRGDANGRLQREPFDGWVIITGLLRFDDESGALRGHLRRGDFVGFGQTDATVVAAGGVALAKFGEDVIERAKMRSVLFASARSSMRAASGAHAKLDDLARFETSSSLLILDGDACVRCGHCSSACAAAHDDGRSRLTRTGPIVALSGYPSAILATSCGHCQTPACLPACPTAAIVRDAAGYVTVREDLCTGCGSCSKACPWENLAMAPRLSLRVDAPKVSPEVAIKCDGCGEREDGPACVSACPTEALARVTPRAVLPELAHALRREPVHTTATLRQRRPSSLFIAAAVAGATSLLALGSRVPASRLGLGLVALASLGWLLGYSAVKRIQKRKAVERTIGFAAAVGLHYRLHVLVGLVCVGATLGHAHLHAAASGVSLARAALSAFGVAALSGLLASGLYRVLPQRLSRLSRREWLPEDSAGRQRSLDDKVSSTLSGTDELVKAIFARFLIPYASSFSAGVRLLAMTATMDREVDRLTAGIGRVLDGRGRARLAGLGAVVDAVVAAKAFRSARWALALMRGAVVIHIAAVATAVLLVGVHVAGALLGILR